MRKTRSGFTLVELLVVMSLIAVLATMAVMFFPNAVTSQREANAAQQLQGWLTIAKQRALRDQAPRGLRLWIKQKADNYYVNANHFWFVVTDCQYIEQPDDYRPSAPITSVALNTPPMNPAYKTVYDVLQIFAPAGAGDLMNGYPPTYDLTIPVPVYPTTATSGNQMFWAVQPCPFRFTGVPGKLYVPDPQGFGGDYLEVYNNGMMHQVIALLNPFTIQIAPPLSNPVNTMNYRIVRSPRAVGSETLTLPEGTFIDLNTNVAYNNPLPNFNDPAAVKGAVDTGATANEGSGFIDILFSPAGAVITPGVATSNLHLWVRAPAEDAANSVDPFRGDPTIVSVFVRTGLVGAYPPNPAGDPYSLVK